MSTGKLLPLEANIFFVVLFCRYLSVNVLIEKLIFYFSVGIPYFPIDITPTGKFWFLVVCEY